MKRIAARLVASLLAVFGLVLLALGAGGVSHAAPLKAGDLPAGMAGVQWDLQSMQTTPTGTTSRPMDDGIVISLEFDGNGNLSGQGACNGYFASYKVGANNAITIGPIGSTQKACSVNLMDLDQEYFGALQTATKYSLYQGTLGFQTNDGNGTLNYISSTIPAVPPTTTGPGMPTTGDGALTTLMLLGLALGICFAAAGVAIRRRERPYSALPIRTKK